MSSRRPVVSVIGDAQVDDPARIVLAERLGDLLMCGGFRIVTGGLGGVMEAVSRGARRSPAWEEGRIVGIVPSYRASDCNPFCDIIVPTGLQLGRNVLVVAAGDVVVALGGGAGTLSEMALAWQLGRPILTLGAEGWAGRLSGESLDARGSMPVYGCVTAEEVVSRCRELASARAEPGEIGSGWRRTGGAS